MTEPVPAGHPEKPQGEEGRAMLERMNTGAHEELAEWGLAHVASVPADRALDVGCGGGANLGRLLARSANMHVVGVDYSDLSVEVSREHNADAIAQERCEVVQADVRELPFEDASFGLVTAFETIYFWPEIDAALAEVARVLEPQGAFLVCNEANGQVERANEIAEQIDQMSIYTAADFKMLLSQAGFTRIDIDDEGEAGRICVVARKVQ